MPDELLERARTFRARLDSVKASLAPRDFEWYPYDSLANVIHVRQLLGQAGLGLADLTGGEVTADIGCGDGDFAFLLESLGHRVHAIDFPWSNHSGMRGIQALKDALASAVEVHAVDIDGRFVLPADSYGAAFLMGVLYHLKNPFYALEALSKQVKHLFLSTRVVAALPGSKMPIRDLPIAYLLDGHELNDDDSNFWVLSEAGVRRLLQRTNWEIMAWFSAPAAPGSDAADCRAFCLARSHWAMAHLDLISGWHAAEEGGFRWTERRCSVRCPERAASLTLDFFLPGPRTISVEAAADGRALGRETYSRQGRHRYTRRLPVDARRIDFEIGNALPPDERDFRERGIAVVALEFPRA